MSEFSPSPAPKETPREFRRSNSPTTIASTDDLPTQFSQNTNIQIQLQAQTPPSEEDDEPEEERDQFWPSSFLARSFSSSTPRSRPPSPSSSPRVFGSFQQQHRRLPQRSKSKRSAVRRRTRSWSFVVWIGVVGLFILVNWWMFSRLQDSSVRPQPKISTTVAANNTSSEIMQGDWINYKKNRRPRGLMYTRLLALSAHALAETDGRPEPRDTWKEALTSASSWVPCADRRSWKMCEGNNGYILVSANGGISQQRVAICNAVAISRLLNSTLVLPRFLHSSVWKDASQFSEIYKEDHFIRVLEADIQIVKELPVELKSLDLEAIGSLVTDAEVMKESKPSFYLKKILPILLKNRVVHFVGFGNRLAFDPIPYELQVDIAHYSLSHGNFIAEGTWLTRRVAWTLEEAFMEISSQKTKCNFHALQFVDKIQKTGALLVQRMRRHSSHWGPLEHNLLGLFTEELNVKGETDHPKTVSRYLAVHVRFEIDMAAYSMCYFGGGKEEEAELEAYRAVHFPALSLLKKTSKIPSASALRSGGKCPLTPEETVIMLAALGFKRTTRIYIAGAEIYGGKSRMAAMRSLYPNLATKEGLLSSSEIEPFCNFSSQLAALDFIVCSAADAFAMTDAGSQFSSLVQGYRMYYGEGRRPTIRPNKRRLASIFARNDTIEWRHFERSVRKATRQSRKVEERPLARSVYRHPRCLECMCLVE